MFTFFALHVLFFSAIAIVLTALPKPIRAACYYIYLSMLLFIGGFLGNAYSLPVFDDVIVSGGNLLYAAFMMTSIVFVLAERDSFILRRIIQLVVIVNAFKVILALLIVRTINAPGIINPHGIPPELFQGSIPFIILGGVLIILELGILLFVFELIKWFTHSTFFVRAAYMATFVAVLCIDGIVFPLIAFGASPEVIAVVVGGLTGKFLTATSYGLAIVAFSAVFPKRFSAYLNSRVFTWRTALSSSSKIIRDLELQEVEISMAQSRIAQSAKLAGLGYAITDQTSGKVLSCDDAYARMHGLKAEEFTALEIDSEIIGGLIHEDDRQKAKEIRNRLLHGEPLIGEFRHILPDGTIRFIRKIFSPLNPSNPQDGMFEVVSQDITESRRLQEQIFQTQKMDAIGKLTGGVAHDFNNLLAVTLGNLEILDDLVEDPNQKELIQNSIASTMRGADLTRNMLSFARQAPLEPTIVDLNHLLQKLQNWMGRTLPSNIDVELSLFDGLWDTEIDPSSAESGILNLIINAHQAMPNGGKLSIETSNVVIDSEFVEQLSQEIEPGPYVVIMVRDTGKGISTENLKNIFEPFFTTKSAGEGSGLGLSMLDGFMKQSGGAIHVSSEPGVGTTFKLYFHAANAAAADGVSTDAEHVLEKEVASHATILLVEDDLNVLAMLKASLTIAGHQVLEATSGDAALKVFEGNQDIDLLLTDIVMPGELQGTALAKVLTDKRPNLPVIFMSGYSSEISLHGNNARSDDVHLMKPVRRKELLSAVSKAIAQKIAN